MAFCYGATKEREQMMMNLIAAISQKTPDEARTQMMIGSKQECLDTIERYGKAGVTHFIFMMMAPYFPDELQKFAEEVIPAARK